VLGIDEELVIHQIKPDPSKPLKFKDGAKSFSIVDIASGYTSMIALTESREIFVWGSRMGIYPQPDLSLKSVERNGKIFNSAEIHQACPRMIKNNLIFHKINKIVSGHSNTALITDKGELLLQGMNEFGQLALPHEVSSLLTFFPEFVKVDALHDYFVKEVTIGSCVIHAICEHKVTGRIKLYGWGSNQNGQLALSNLEETKREPYDMTSVFIEQKSNEEDVIFDEDEIIQVTSGGFHSLFLIKKSPD
jgi:alpha-tubulin suppressor-like RCC1 family protein